VVYEDNDPMVLSHARAVLAENPLTAVAEGDLRNPAGIIGHPVVRAHLDWSRPIGLLLSGVMHQIMDYEQPARLTGELITALPSGSYVFIHHLLDLGALGDPGVVQLKEFMTRAFGRAEFRTLDRVRELFCGLELVEPGLVRVRDWRPDGAAATGADEPPGPGLGCAGVARKP
jgi:hypothetical protein